jgi:hypothetical protein
VAAWGVAFVVALLVGFRAFDAVPVAVGVGAIAEVAAEVIWVRTHRHEPR